MSHPSQALCFLADLRATLAVCAVVVFAGTGCTTFSPATSAEPDYYIDEYGMVHTPQRDLSSGSYQLRPAYGRFSSGGGVFGSQFYDPFYDPFRDSSYGYRYGFGFDPFNLYLGSRHPFYARRPFVPGYFRPPVSGLPVAPVTNPAPGSGAASGGEIQRVPLASPANIIRSAPEPILRPDRRVTSDGRARPVNSSRPTYGSQPRATRPSQRPRTGRPAPSRPPPPKSKPRVIDP